MKAISMPNFSCIPVYPKPILVPKIRSPGTHLAESYMFLLASASTSSDEISLYSSLGFGLVYGTRYSGMWAQQMFRRKIHPFTLKLEAGQSSEMLVYIYQTTRRHASECYGMNLHSRICYIFLENVSNSVSTNKNCLHLVFRNTKNIILLVLPCGCRT
jgi:hypothetical protein